MKNEHTSQPQQNGINNNPEAEPNPSFWVRHESVLMGLITVIIVLVILYPWIITAPSLNKEREEAIEQSHRLICEANLKGLAMACKIYAHDHDRTFPDTIQTLLDSGFITRQSLVCPNINKQTVNTIESYVYISGQTLDSYYKNILAYENPENHNNEGGVVVFVSGNAKFVTPYSEVERLIKVTKQRLANK